jgi:hypothetical protein
MTSRGSSRLYVTNEPAETSKRFGAARAVAAGGGVEVGAANASDGVARPAGGGPSA